MRVVATVGGLLAALLGTACGRIAFDPLSDLATGDAGSDGPAGFCGTVPPGYALCTDFDSGDIMAGFTGKDEVPAGTVVANTTMVESAPTSLQTVLGPAAMLQYGDLSFTVPSANGIELHTSLYMPQRPTATYEINSINTVVPGVGTFYNDFDIAVTGVDRYRQEFQSIATGGMGRTDPMVQMTTGAWHHVVVDVDFMLQTYVVTIDGATAISSMFAYPIEPGMTTVQIGANYISSGITGAGVIQDNVVIYVR